MDSSDGSYFENDLDKRRNKGKGHDCNCDEIFLSFKYPLR